MPLRRRDDGQLDVLLVTSRDTGRWVIPKGWPWMDHSDQEAVAGEAFEEAGVLGSVDRVSLGHFTYEKKSNGEGKTVAVDVYLLWVETELEDWPEHTERERKWFSTGDAARAVDEAQLRAMILALADLLRSQ